MFDLGPQSSCDTFVGISIPGPLLSGLEFVLRALRLSESAEADYRGIANLARLRQWRFPMRTIRAFLQHPPHAVVVTDSLQRIQVVTAGFTAMTGYAPEQALGRFPNFLQGPQTSLESRHAIRTRLENQEGYEGVVVNYRANGELYRCQVEINPVFDARGRVVNFIAFESEVA